MKYISFSLAVLTALSFNACGGGGGSSSSNKDTTPDTKISKDITVERGATYDAIVTDSSTQAQVAVQKNGQNVYTFEKTPKYPIIVNGGWIDVDGDGELTIKDVELKMTMKSYSSNVTPITTYIAHSNKTERNKKLKELATISGASEEELMKVASKANTKAIIAINAIYQEMKKENSTNISSLNLKATMSALENTDLKGITNSKEIAKRIEAKVMSNLGDKISEMTYTKMNGLQKFRLFDEKWENIKSIGNGTKAERYVGNKIKIIDNKFNLIASNQLDKDSRAELRARLESPISEFTAKVNGTSLLGNNGKVQVNAYMSNGSKKYLLTGITIRDKKISYWAENEDLEAKTSDDITTESTKIADTTESFENVNLSCQILTDGNKFQYIVKNLDTGETYPTKELDITSYTNTENQKFTILNVRVRFDHRAKNTLTSVEKNKKMKMVLSDLDTK